MIFSVKQTSSYSSRGFPSSPCCSSRHISSKSGCGSRLRRATNVERSRRSAPCLEKQIGHMEAEHSSSPILRRKMAVLHQFPQLNRILEPKISLLPASKNRSSRWCQPQKYFPQLERFTLQWSWLKLVRSPWKMKHRPIIADSIHSVIFKVGSFTLTNTLHNLHSFPSTKLGFPSSLFKPWHNSDNCDGIPRPRSKSKTSNRSWWTPGTPWDAIKFLRWLLIHPWFCIVVRIVLGDAKTMWKAFHGVLKFRWTVP